ncbi:MAG: hypothetical protein ACFFG0_04745 [Candidatus Thorarchaeota archaeon]
MPEQILLKEISDKYYDSHNFVDTVMKLLLERNVRVICKLWEYYKKYNGVEDIRSFIDKEF